ncbi:hypothetical protein BD410DRAFT_837603 [Rickenella mellea]|uniref:ZZ-type domain-containing protein n=1 Tax=Rickenella mellea TaxID=50990 RepID=A0A4Y7QEZ2_9AGAM|nr:hypothetical protein BD410DRAFT_837603 [Rickenella mellea]
MAGFSTSDVMAMTPRECLIPLKRVMDALNAVKGVHPFVGLAVTAFEVLLTLEIKRRENDKRVSGILLKQADMMMALLQLDNIKDMDMKDEKGEAVSGRLQTLIAEIRKDIMTCGNVIDTYYKQKILAKLLRAGSWEDKFVGFASTFDQREQEIKFALEIHVTIKLDTVAGQVKSIDVKMNMLIHLFKEQTPKEKELAAEVERLGGVETCMHREGILAQLDHDKTVGGKTSTSLLASVRTPVETLIEDNRAYFDVKMEAQTMQIDNAIQRSTRRMIRAIGEGPWKRIQDLDIRQVWKEMNAHSSVKARYLVLALHDHYLDQYENINEETSLDIIPPSSTVSHADTDATNAEVDADAAFLHNPPPEADKWCLQYLTIQNISPIAEAIDDDVSGFIKIAEVNTFLMTSPRDFPCYAGSLSGPQVQWLALRWAVEASLYHLRIEALIEKLFDIAVMPENSGSYASYKYWLTWICWLLRSRSHATTEDPELIDLIRQHMKLQEMAITDALLPAKREIDTPDTVSTLLGPGRIEKLVIDERPFLAACATVFSVLHVCDERMTTLAASFEERRGVDYFKRFAGGLFNNWHNTSFYKIAYDENDHPDCAHQFILADSEQKMDDPVEDIPELKIEQLQDIVDATPQLIESEEHRAYIDLYKKKLTLEYSLETLDDADTSKLAEFDRIPESERDICQHIATQEFNKGGYQCIQCDGYILCADCISHETDEGTGHRSTHVFTRFSGEPLAFNETTQETETSDRERLVKIETVLGEMKEQSAMQGNLIKSLAEQLTRQESPIKSLSDALSRGVGDKGIAVTD